MTAVWYTILSILDLLLQLTAAFFSYQIYTFNKLSKGWLAVPIGFLLLAVRRIILYFSVRGYIPAISGVSPLVESLLVPFLISIMLVFGIWAMYNNFQKFSLVEMDVEKKVQSFKKSQIKKKRR